MAYRSIGAVKKNGGSGNLASVGLPAGHVAGDILVLVISVADNVVCSVDQSYTNKLATNSGTSCRQEVWWKRDTGAEVAPTVTHAAGNSGSAFILAFSAEAGAGDPFSAAAAQGNLGSATVTAPTITPGNGEDVIFVGTACSNTDTAGAPMTQASYSGTNPTFTERGDGEESTGTKEAATAVATGISNGSGTGSRTSTVTSGFAAAAIDNVGALLSLLPGATTAAPVTPVSIPNPHVGPMSLRQRIRRLVPRVFASTGVNQAITPDTGISATSSVTGNVVRLAAVTPAAINATSTVTGSVIKLALVKPAAISSTSAVSASVIKLARITPAAISSTSTVSARVIRLAAVRPSAISSTSNVFGVVTKLGTSTRASIHGFVPPILYLLENANGYPSRARFIERK